MITSIYTLILYMYIKCFLLISQLHVVFHLLFRSYWYVQPKNAACPEKKCASRYALLCTSPTIFDGENAHAYIHIYLQSDCCNWGHPVKENTWQNGNHYTFQYLQFEPIKCWVQNNQISTTCSLCDEYVVGFSVSKFECVVFSNTIW